MYLMYVDETGDTGLKPNSSKYFALSALVVHESYWTETMESMWAMKKSMHEKYGFLSSYELHAENLVGRTRKGVDKCGMNRHQVMMMMRELLLYESRFNYARSFNVIVDKSEKDDGFDVFSTAWKTLIGSFDRAVSNGLLPSPWGVHPDAEKGFVIVDETDENKLRHLVRSMRHGIEDRSITSIIEDPMHKRSDDTLPIQFCDINAYFLKQSIDPNGTVLKNKARNYFYYLKPILQNGPWAENEYGIMFA